MNTTRTASLPFFLMVLALATGICVWMTLPYLLALLMGSILALLSHPLYLRLTKRGLGPKWSSLLVTIGITVLVLGPLSLFVGLAIKQAIALGQSLAQNESFSFESILSRLANWPIVHELVGSPQEIEGQIRSALGTLGTAASSWLLKIVGNIPDLLLQSILALLTCFVALIDGKRFVVWLTSKLPIDSYVADQLIRTFKDTSISVIWATLAAAGAQAALMCVSFLILGVPAAFLAGGLTFIFAWIPMVGSVPVWVGGAIYLYTQGAVVKMVIMICLGLVTGVIDNLIRPLVLKGRSELHPLVSLVVIFGGINLFGIFGVFVGPILAAILISLLEIWPTVVNRSKQMIG